MTGIRWMLRKFWRPNLLFSWREDLKFIAVGAGQYMIHHVSDECHLGFEVWVFQWVRGKSVQTTTSPDLGTNKGNFWSIQWSQCNQNIPGTDSLGAQVQLPFLIWTVSAPTRFIPSIALLFQNLSGRRPGILPSTQGTPAWHKKTYLLSRPKWF